MLDVLCFAAFATLGFGRVCSDDPPPACARYARVLQNPESAQRLAQWYAGLPRQMDPKALKENLASPWLDPYEIPLTLDPAQLGLEPSAVAMVSVDQDTHALLSASITDRYSAFFVFPPDRMADAYGQKALKLPTTDQVGIFCHMRD